MRIGIDARFYNESGVGRYLRNLIGNLKSIDKKNEYYIFLLPRDFEGFKVSDNFQKIKADFSWYGLAEQLKFPKLLNKYDLDLVHFPHFNTPIFYKRKFVVTIHDLIHQHFRMAKSTTHDPIIYKIKQIGYQSVFKNAVKKSQRILVPSDYVLNLLIKEWGVENEKIVVTTEGVDKSIEEINDKMNEKRQKEIIEKFNIHSPYIFYVGNAHPHKNVEGLIGAFLELRKKHKSLQLVLAGQDHYFWKRLKKENQHEDIIYVGRVSDEELVALYKKAQCFVMPSHEEGFGIPILEAMVCSCPVVSSKSGSLGEVGGDAVIYFDSLDRMDIVSKIESVLDSKK